MKTVISELYFNSNPANDKIKLVIILKKYINLMNLKANFVFNKILLIIFSSKSLKNCFRLINWFAFKQNNQSSQWPDTGLRFVKFF